MTNSKLIKKRKKYEQLDKTSPERKIIQDTINLYLDAPSFDSSELEKYIIDNFWQSAYTKYKDAGYLSNDMESVKIRFDYESQKLESIIKKEVKSKKIALDIGCGDGRYSRVFSKLFDKVIGVDLSSERINKNIIENSNKNINYIVGDVFNHKDIKGIKFDFIFFGGIMLYSQEDDINEFFLHTINLLNHEGIAIARESVYNHQNTYYKSLNYVAYYRDKNFYSQGVFSKYYYKSYLNSGYHIRDLNKYLVVNHSQKEQIIQNPAILDKIVQDYIDPHITTNYFFGYKKI